MPATLARRCDHNGALAGKRQCVAYAAPAM
jgi:hypothetical protein